MKTNFRPKKERKSIEKSSSINNENEKKDLTKEEFEEFISKSGAAGSFMIFRSKNKKEELGIDQL